MGEPDSEEEEKSRFYDVDKFKELIESQGARPQPGAAKLVWTRIRQGLDSISGFFAALLGLPILFGGVFAVVIGALYGPLVFLAALGGTLGLLAFYVERKVGKSMQFGDYNLMRRMFGQIVGFALVLSLLYLLIVIVPGLIHKLP